MSFCRKKRGEWMLTSIRNNLFLLLIAICAVQCRTREIIVPAPPTEEFCTGDLAFRLGRTLESDAIAATAEEGYDYSHIGIIISRGDSIRVIHIEPERGGEERVKCETLEDFFHPARAVKGCVARHKNISSNETQSIEGKCISLYNSDIHFDHDYSLQDSETMYCTELVNAAFSEIGISLTERRHKVPLIEEGVILPSDMLRDGDLEIVWRYSERRPARHN